MTARSSNGTGAMDYGKLGFHRVAVVQPRVRLADPLANAREIDAWAKRAAARGASVVLFPELSITGYTCEDLFHSRGLLDGVREALGWLSLSTVQHQAVLVVGAPCALTDGRLFNAAFVLEGGHIVGAVPKIHIPNHGEYYERRWFASGRDVDVRVRDDAMGDFRLSSRQLFARGNLTFAIEICEDLWAPIPPSGEHALAGAAAIFNPSASNELVAKADYRRDLVRQQSARLLAGYVYASSGPTESTKDLVFGGHGIVAECGVLLAESERFARDGAMAVADLDVERLVHDRLRNATWTGAPRPGFAYETVELPPPASLPALERTFAPTPFVPDDPATRDERAAEILSIQAHGLARRLDGCSARPVVGVSGGLDSTLALHVAVRATRLLARSPADVVAVSLPGPGTSGRTRRSASALASALGVTFREIPIAAAVEQHFRDLGHDPSRHDVVYENSQARERTQILFDLANAVGGLVVGTGDLSELALGWCTYNADHMASYAVNVGVPKTLVRHLIDWFGQHEASGATREVLAEVLATPISPELLPPSADGAIAQETEALIGPYLLHDFFLYHHLRHGSSPRRILALATLAFDGEFPPDAIRGWLRVFLERFHRQQFKRTCLPPGPKVGTISLSPRGDLRMPDEVDPAWLLAQLD